MVFSNLTDEDKTAFFALLDEYFSSRPELADALKLQLGNNSGVNANHGVAAAHRALANNPQVASAIGSAGLRAAVPKSSPFAAAVRRAPPPLPTASNPQLSNAVGRFAAKSLAFNGGNPSQPPAVPSPKEASSELRPPPPPRRSTSNSSLNTTASEAPPRAPPRTKPALTNGPVTQRKLGEADTSSGKNTMWGTRNKETFVPAAPPPSKAKLPPPPRRGTVPKPRTPTPEPEDEDEDEDEHEGEWAEALYDYKSTDPNDLPLQAEQRVLVTARTSDDWWTGEADGKSGLFPASYVKLL